MSSGDSDEFISDKTELWDANLLCWSWSPTAAALDKSQTLRLGDPNLRGPATTGSSQNCGSGSSRLLKPESSPGREGEGIHRRSALRWQA